MSKLRAFFVSVGSLGSARIANAASQVVILPIVARYLSPTEFAVVALAMSVVVFGQVLSDAGIGKSLLRSAEFDPEEWSSVYWLLFGFGCVLFLVLAVTAPLWAALLQEPRLTTMIAVLAVAPLLAALSAVPHADIERRERFGVLAVVQTVSSLAGLAVAVALAIAGAGAWALAAQQLVIAGVRLGGVVYASEFRPQRVFHVDKLRRHVTFARDTVGVSILLAVQLQAPVVIIGRVLGAPVLGMFVMCQRFVRLPQVGVAGPGAQVLYVRMTRRIGDARALGALYVGGTVLMAIALMAPMAALAGIGHVAFPYVLSEKWLAVATLFALLAPGAAVELALTSTGPLFLATGRTGLRVRMSAERAILRVGAVAVAAPFGVEAASAALSGAILLYAPRQILMAARCAEVDLREMAIALAIPAGFALALGFGLFFATPVYFSGLHPVVVIAIGGLGALLAMALSALAMKSRVLRALDLLRA